MLVQAAHAVQPGAAAAGAGGAESLLTEAGLAAAEELVQQLQAQVPRPLDLQQASQVCLACRAHCFWQLACVVRGTAAC